MRLGREENLAAPFAKRRAVIIETAGVRGRGVAVTDALIESARDDTRGLIGFAPRTQDPFAAQAEERNLTARFAEEPCGNWHRHRIELANDQKRRAAPTPARVSTRRKNNFPISPEFEEKRG